MSKGGITRQELGDSLNQELDFITGSKKVEKSLSGTSTVKTSIKSPVNVKRIDGKTIVNLVPLFDNGAWKKEYGEFTVEVLSSNHIKVTGTTTGLTDPFVHYHPVVLKPNTQYTLIGEITGGIFADLYLDSSFDSPDLSNTNGQVTITTPSNTAGLRVRVFGKGKDSGTIKNLMLVEGAQAQPFVANIKGLTNPTIANETNGTSLVVPTTLYDGEYVEQNASGELVKYKKWQEMVITGNEDWSFGANYTGYKRVQLLNSVKGILDIQKGIKYNGMITSDWTTSSYSSADVLRVTGDNLHITISNADSGWGDNYTPTPDEIKAYFLGWRMANTSISWEAQYNGTGAKGWAFRNALFNGKYESATLSSGTDKLPTTQAEINSKWRPYRLIYELATPIQEVIQLYSDLTLEKGENSVKVYAGRIVNEFNKVGNYREGSINVYLINDKGVSNSILTYKADKILKVYENGKLFTKHVLSSINANGNQKVDIKPENYDPTASYTVDYEPLYTWEVTAPIDSVQLQYFETLQAVVDELTLESGKQQETINRLLDNVVNENQGIQWMKPTYLNGVTGASACRFGKDSNGTVYVYLYISITKTMNSTEAIYLLPKGYRPKDSFYVPSIEYSTTNTRASGIICVSHSGTISVGMPTAFNNGNIIASAIFKAEQ